MPEPEDASPFAGAAPYYDRFRAPYPPAALDCVIEAYGLGAASRVLDLGSGPGSLAIPLSRAVAELVAVDPDAGMIAEGRRLAAANGRTNIRWLNAAAEAVALDAGPFQAATSGQAFHWMDRDEVLSLLAVLIADGGGLALVNPGKRRPQESWEPAAEAVITRFLGPRTRHPRSNPQEPANEPALLRSACFSKFTCREFPSTITRDVASIIGCVYSISSSARPLFGDAAETFEAALSKALFDLNPSGIFKERLETEVTLAPKQAR
jgi:ubiquinone/menaquinone biosynthesis C-methylase UbiE